MEEKINKNNFFFFIKKAQNHKDLLKIQPSVS